MTLLGVLILIIIVAVIFWVTGQIPQPYQTWVRVVVGILLVIYLLSLIGAFDGMNFNAPIRR